MDLSVVIVSWNTRSMLLDCLKTVRENVHHSNWQTEVFVVDNASDDGSAQAFETDFRMFVS
jgi:GT2 family glycosyltransferase